MRARCFLQVVDQHIVGIPHPTDILLIGRRGVAVVHVDGGVHCGQQAGHSHPGNQAASCGLDIAFDLVGQFADAIVGGEQNVIAIRLPPLAEREGDVPLLANFFLARKRVAMQKEIKSIEPDAMELLSRYSWPGNVRELENTIERAVAMAEGDVVRVADLPPHINQLTIETYRHASGEIPTLEEMEKRYILWVLEKHKGNKTKASAAMGIDRVSLWRKIKRYGIED